MKKNIQATHIKNCHTRAGGYPWTPDQVGRDRAGESGRSMVEMLGVLAIIGVLSIGGIAGYTMAMNKHRANELLDGGSKRAMVAMQQIALGYDAKDVSFAEFTGEDGFTGSPVAVGSGLIGIQASNVKQAVCETLVNMTDRENVFVSVNDETPEEPIGVEDCEDGMDILLVYKMGQSAGTGGSGDDDDDSCTLTAADCINGLADGECACAPASGATCTSHTDTACGSGYYCQFSPSDCGDSDRGDGVCTAIGGSSTVNGGYLLSSSDMDWWSANSWCAANGGHLVTGTIAGHALNSYYENYDGNGDIYTYFGQNMWFWTGNDYGNSCSAWLVNATSDGEIVDYTDRTNYYYALCAF